MLSLKIAFLAMMMIVASSNYLVLFPINDWLTWGAFIYPISFLITEMTNRSFGPSSARKVAYAGFTVGVLLSFYLSIPKIALASGFAFLVSQLLDIYVFTRLRSFAWWYAPFFASVWASCIDSSIFWTLAFWGENLPSLTWAIGDTFVKIAVDILMLLPFRIFLSKSLPGQLASK